MAAQHTNRSSHGIRWWLYVAMIGGLLAAYALGAMQGNFHPAILTVSIGAAAGWVAWCLFGDRARGRRRCPRCGYDTSGNRESDLTCPECGKTVRSPRGFQRTKRHWRRAVVGVLPILLGVGTWMYVMARQHGWAKVLPDVALALVAPMDLRSELYSELEERLGDKRTGPSSEWLSRQRVRANLSAGDKQWLDAAYLLPHGTMTGFEKELIEGLSSADPAIAKMAADRLVETTLTPEGRGALVQAVKDREQLWLGANQTMWSGLIGEANLVESAPTLARIASSSASDRNRFFAVAQLVYLHPSPPESESALLLVVMEDPSEWVRHSAARATMWSESRLRPELARAVLAAYLDSGEPKTVAHLVRSIGFGHAEADIGVPVLTSLLEDPTSIYRLQAIRSLGKLGELAKDALPALESIAFNPTNDPQTISAAFAAIQAINAELP